jgi:TonB family protein
MQLTALGCYTQSCASAVPWVRAALCCVTVAVAFGPFAAAQGAQPAKVNRPDVLQQTANTPLVPIDASKDSDANGITEDEIKQLVVGKTLYLRNGYLDNALEFDEYGRLMGHSPQGSYALCLIQIDKVHMTKRKVELTGVRYGLHFLGALPNEDPTKAVDRVRITPKKKVFKVTIDRELVVIPKKKKEKKKAEPIVAKTQATSGESVSAGGASDGGTVTTPTAIPQREIQGAIGRVTTTTSPAHSARLTREALDQVFSQGLDDRLIASLPTFWKLYYQAVANRTDYRPADPSIYRQSTVDQKAKLLTVLEPPSNEYAQANGVAGMALYHAVIGTDGKAQEIVVARPIGFGLDENAADTIRKASFQPAMKDGKLVPVLIDLVVQFRIFSKRTSQPSNPGDAMDSGPKLPGPYSVNNP